MSTTLHVRLNESRERLDMARQFVTQRAEELAHRTRDEALHGLLKTTSAALTGLARLTAALPGARSLSPTFAARASALQEASTELARPPIPRYDELNVKQVQEALDGLSRWEVAKVRSYELQHKARKTVLAACDRRLEA